jgi:hypothetical protein
MVVHGELEDEACELGGVDDGDNDSGRVSVCMLIGKIDEAFD